MEILLMRHGQSVADIEDRHEGRADFPLTDVGRTQAEAAANWIANRYPPDTIIASPLRRAAETADILATRLNREVTVDQDLMEMNNGVYAGLTRAEARMLYPWPSGGFKPHEAQPEGESRIAFRCRIETFWSRFLHSGHAQNECVAIVTHGGVIRMLYHCFLQLPVEADVRVATGDTGVHHWRLEDGVRTILFANRLDHLSGVELPHP